jgi:hypothetical protein
VLLLKARLAPAGKLAVGRLRQVEVVQGFGLYVIGGEWVTGLMFFWFGGERGLGTPPYAGFTLFLLTWYLFWN